MPTQYGPGSWVEVPVREGKANVCFNPVNHPEHYVQNGMEAIDVIEAFAAGNYHRGNALKYLLRAGRKDATEQDLRKAIWYIEREIKVLASKAGSV